jgi:FdhE protein
MVEYYRQIEAFLGAEVDRLQTLPFVKPAEAERLIPFLTQKESLTSLAYVFVDSERLSANFFALVDLLLTCSPENPLALALQQHAAALAAMPWTASVPELEDNLSQWAEREGLDSSSLLQLLHWAMSPFWRLAAKRYADELRQLVTNEKSTCPICGHYPDFAILDDNEHGRRYLHCLCCNWQWPFKRMGCGYCGNEDYGQLGYIVSDEFKGYKIYTCEHCKSYLKTVDQRAATARLDHSPMLEHVKSLFLDLLAIEKGYLPMHG